MREIKFRAWDKEFNQYSPRATQHPIKDINYLTDYVWEQFVGLLDKNGKEIYEGDIVIQREEVKNPRTRESYKKPRFVERKGIIVFQDGCFDFKNERYSGQIRCYMGYGKGNIQLEVIGNIHENGELLEK